MKLFSTSSLLIPTTLKITIIPVTPKIVVLLFKVGSPLEVVVNAVTPAARVVDLINSALGRQICRMHPALLDRKKLTSVLTVTSSLLNFL